MMPPIELGAAVGIAKYAPVFFLVAHEKGVSVNWHQLGHTLLVSAIVAVVTMYGTSRAMSVQMEYMEKQIARLTTLSEEAVRVQREIVPMRNLQVKTLQDAVADHEVRLTKLERKPR